MYYGRCASGIFTTVFWQMELICANSKRDSGTKFTRHVQNFAYHVPLNCKPTGFAHVNGKKSTLGTLKSLEDPFELFLIGEKEMNCPG